MPERAMCAAEAGDLPPPLSRCDTDPGGLCQYDLLCPFYAENCRKDPPNDRDR